MLLRPPRSTRTYTLCPYTTLVRARLVEALAPAALAGGGRIAVADRQTAVGILAGGDLGPGRNCRAGTRQRRRCRNSGRGPGGGYRRRRSGRDARSEEHTSELQSLMRISYADFCLKQKQTNTQ